MAKNLQELGLAISRIREAVNSIEIKGRQNATYIYYINHQCDEMIGDINEAIKNANTEHQETNNEMDGDLSGQNTGIS